MNRARAALSTRGYLLLEDGRRFDGRLTAFVPEGLPAGNTEPGIGEVVFQTGMTGYQEVITDPSYRGQIVTFTAPHIGNTGINRPDDEAPAPALAGIIVRSLTERPSSWRSEESLSTYLSRHGIPCLCEVDTRALTRHLRDAGSLRGMIVSEVTDPDVALARVRAFPGLVGRDLVREVAPARAEREFRSGTEIRPDVRGGPSGSLSASTKTASKPGASVRNTSRASPSSSRTCVATPASPYAWRARAACRGSFSIVVSRPPSGSARASQMPL